MIDMKKFRFKGAYILLPIIFLGNYLTASDGLFRGTAEDRYSPLFLSASALVVAALYQIDKRYGFQYYKRHEGPSRIYSKRSRLLIKFVKILCFYLGFIDLSVAFSVGIFAFKGLYNWWGPFKILLDGLVVWIIYFIAVAALKLPQYQVQYKDKMVISKVKGV